MESDVVSIDVPQSFPGHVRVYSMPVRSLEFVDVPLANADEVATFATVKRNDEHLSGRWLLGHCLGLWGVDDLGVLEIARDEHRAPRVTFLQGMWKNTPLPSFSISHSDGQVFLALSDSNFNVGIDAEPAQRSLSTNAFDLISKGEELERLRKNPEAAMTLWTSKEAIQKAMQMGMHLNPRKIEVSIGQSIQNISIENSNIQLVNWAIRGYQLALAIRPKTTDILTAEDQLLEETRMAMLDRPEWGVGCNTNRNNV
jgi:4'-phosphopantetheinyl transferase EntD